MHLKRGSKKYIKPVIVILSGVFTFFAAYHVNKQTRFDYFAVYFLYFISTLCAIAGILGFIDNRHSIPLFFKPNFNIKPKDFCIEPPLQNFAYYFKRYSLKYIPFLIIITATYIFLSKEYVSIVCILFLLFLMRDIFRDYRKNGSG